MMVAKIKALLYREWVLAGKHHLGVLLMLILIMVLFWLVRLSMEFGNIAKGIAEDPSIMEIADPMTYFMGTYLIALCSGALFGDNGVGMSDIRSGWRVYSDALPITPLELTIERYIAKVFWLLVALVLSVANAAIMGVIADKPFTGAIIINCIMCINVHLILDFIQQPIQIFARDIKTYNYSKILLAFVGMMIGILAATNSKVLEQMPSGEDGLDVDTLAVMQDKLMVYRDMLAPWMIPLMFALLVLGFIITLYICKRRARA